jgi:hypothetical protein
VSIIMRTIPALWQQCQDIRAQKAQATDSNADTSISGSSNQI